MGSRDAETNLDQALERIEAAILPSVALMLDSLIDAASLARPGADGDAYATELRRLARDLGSITCALESVTRTHGGDPYAAASAA